MKNLPRISYALFASLAMTIFLSAQAQAQDTEIDVLVVYDADAEAWLGGEPEVEMQEWVNSVNTFMEGSLVDIQINLVGVVEIPVSEPSAGLLHYDTKLPALRSGEEGTVYKVVPGLRDSHGADLVVKLEEDMDVPVLRRSAYENYQDNRIHSVTVGSSEHFYYGSGTREQVISNENNKIFTKSTSYTCSHLAYKGYRVEATSCSDYSLYAKPVGGYAYITNSAGSAFSLVDAKGGAKTFAHEIGHNMGLAHDRVTSPNSFAVYEHGRGYGVEGYFATIMAYRSNYGGETMSGSPHIPRFSNPRVEWPRAGGNPTGVHTNHADSAYAAFALRQVADTIASHRETVPNIGETGPGTAECLSTCAIYEGTYNYGMCLYYSPSCN